MLLDYPYIAFLKLELIPIIMPMRNVASRSASKTFIRKKDNRKVVYFSQSVSYDLLQKIIAFRKKHGISTDQEVVRIAVNNLVSDPSSF